MLISINFNNNGAWRGTVSCIDATAPEVGASWSKWTTSCYEDAWRPTQSCAESATPGTRAKCLNGTASNASAIKQMSVNAKNGLQRYWQISDQALITASDAKKLKSTRWIITYTTKLLLAMCSATNCNSSWRNSHCSFIAAHGKDRMPTDVQGYEGVSYSTFEVCMTTEVINYG